VEEPAEVAWVGSYSFGELLRAHRNRSGLSQEALAARAGLGERTVRNLETGRTFAPRGETALLLMEALQLSGPEREAFAVAANSGWWRSVTEPISSGDGAWRWVDTPAQLPLDVRGFVGRQADLARLDAIIADAASQPTTVAVAAISGSAGVGKTALAVHWAHRVRDQFPDGQLYVNLRGFDPNGSPTEPGEAVRRLLDGLCGPAQLLPSDLETQILGDRREEGATWDSIGYARQELVRQPPFASWPGNTLC
jgi:transcriptional regulator with XRE-family HTH domain